VVLEYDVNFFTVWPLLTPSPWFSLTIFFFASFTRMKKLWMQLKPSGVMEVKDRESVLILS
jgi:hypothetical protein